MSIPLFNLASLIKKPETNPITPDAAAAAAAATEPKKAPANRCECDGCRIKLHLADLTCRCGARYCSKHRHPEDHKCTFDYKGAGKALLAATLIKVDGAKIEKI